MSSHSLPKSSGPTIWQARTLSTEANLQGKFLSDEERKSLRGHESLVREQIENTIETLDYLRGISELEPKFSNLMDDVIHTAITLCNYTNQQALVNFEGGGLAETKDRMGDCWSYLNELAGALQFHIHEAFAYHKYHLELIDCKQNFEEVKRRWHSKWNENKDRSIEESVQELRALRNEMKPYKDMSEQFSKKGLKISPLHLRRGLKPRVPHSAVLLTTICLEDGTWLERGSLVTVSTSSHVSTAIHQEWQVEATLKSGRKKIIRLPSSCLWLISPENSPRSSGSHKSASPLTNEFDQPFDINHLNNILASTELANEVDGFYREIKGEYRQDVLLDLDHNLQKELTKTNGPIKTEDLGKMRELLNDANLLTEGHPVNHTELVQNTMRNARNIEEHLIPVQGKEKPDITSKELERMYTPLKAWKEIHNDVEDFSKVQQQIARETKSRPSPSVICKDIKTLLDKQQVPTYSKNGGLTCLSDMQSIGSSEDLHRQLKQLSRNASVRRSRKKITSFTQMSPESVRKLNDDSSYFLTEEIAYGESSAAHMLPCPCKYCGLKKAAMEEVTMPVLEVRPTEAELVHAAAPTPSSLPRYPLDDLPAAYGRDRDDYSIATEKEPGLTKKEGTYKGTGRFKFGKKTPKGGKSGHASDDYTSGIESGAETTLFEQDAPPSEASKKSKVLCPAIPQSTGSGKKVKRPPMKGHTLELPDPPEHEMMEVGQPGSPRRRINEPQPRGVEGYTWVTRGIPVGNEVPEQDTIVQRSTPVFEESPLPRTPFIEATEPGSKQYVAPTKPMSRSSFDGEKSHPLVIDEMVESLRRSRKLKQKKGRDYEDSTLQPLSRSRERPVLLVKEDPRSATQFAPAPQQPTLTDDDITDDFSQIRTSEHSETFTAVEREGTVLPPPLQRSRPKQKYLDKAGKGKSLSRPVSSGPQGEYPEAGAYTQVCRPLSRDRAFGLMNEKDTKSLERGTLANTSLQAHSPLMKRMFSEEYIRRAVEEEAKKEKYDAFAQAKYMSSRRNSSFKNHRTQAGFPAINKTVRAVAVQIGTMDTDVSLGPSIVEVEKPYKLCNDGSSHFIQDEEPAIFESAQTAKAFATPQFSARLDDDDSVNTEQLEAPRAPRVKRRAKRIQCGSSCVEKKNYSTAFQIGPRTTDTAVEAQQDLLVNYISQYKSPGLGKKMQVGETLEEFRRGQKTAKLNYNQEDLIPDIQPYPFLMTERSHMVSQAPHSMTEGRLPMPVKGIACPRCGRYTPEARSKRIQKGASQVLYDQEDGGESACASSPMMAMIRRSKLKDTTKHKHRARSASNIYINIRIVDDSDDSYDEENSFCVNCEGDSDRKVYVHVDGDRARTKRRPRSKRSHSCDDFYGIWESIERSGDVHDRRLGKLVDQIGFRGVEERLKKMKRKDSE